MIRLGTKKRSSRKLECCDDFQASYEVPSLDVRGGAVEVPYGDLRVDCPRRCSIRGARGDPEETESAAPIPRARAGSRAGKQGIEDPTRSASPEMIMSIFRRGFGFFFYKELGLDLRRSGGRSSRRRYT